jgi:plasmid stability protein
VRNVPDEIHRNLRIRAAANGRSMEAEVRDILQNTLSSERRVRMGDALAALGRRLGLTGKDFETMEKARTHTPAEPMSFK